MHSLGPDTHPPWRYPVDPSQCPSAFLSPSASRLRMTGGCCTLTSDPKPEIGPDWLIPGGRILDFFGVASGSKGAAGSADEDVVRLGDLGVAGLR